MSAAGARLGAWASSLRAELATNRRLAALLLLVPGVLLVWLALLAGDAAGAARAEHAALARQSARLTALADSRADWRRRAEAESVRLAEWESQLWRADSVELAAADLQTAVQRLSARHLGWNRLKLAAPEPLPAIGGWRIRAELNGRLEGNGVLALLQDIAGHAPHIRVDELTAQPLRGQTVSLRLSVLVAAPGEAAR